MQTNSIYEIGGIQGWAGFAGYLGVLGVDISEAALVSIASRYPQLPRAGGGVRGKRAWFCRADISRWLQFLAGITLTARLAQVGEDGLFEPKRLPRVRRGRADRPLEWPIPCPLYVVTDTTKSLGEQVYRTPGGAVRVEMGMLPIDDTPIEDWPGLRLGYFRYDGARISRPSDLVARAYAAGRREKLPALALVGAFAVEGIFRRGILVDGTLFDLAPGTATRFLASNRHPQFEAMVAKIKREEKEPVFVTWFRRTPVEPTTWEPFGSIEPDIADMLRF